MPDKRLKVHCHLQADTHVAYHRLAYSLGQLFNCSNFYFLAKRDPERCTLYPIFFLVFYRNWEDKSAPAASSRANQIIA